MKNITCPLCCNMGFSSREDLKEHLQKVTSSLNCPLCLVSCKNITNLIKHLDVCNVPGDSSSQSIPLSAPSDGDRDASSRLTDNDDDDVEGYFCTVCDIKIPDVYNHIQQFHNGQEVILQDDDEDSDGSKPSPSRNSSHSDTPGTKRKQEEVVNGASLKNKKVKSETVEEDDEESEAFYCPTCNTSFLSLDEHKSKYHQTDEILVKDISITDLFPESKRINNAWCYLCSCCQKTIVRKATLAKHLKLTVCNKSKKNDKDSEPCNSEADKSMNSELDSINLEPGTEYEIEEVKLENYDFDDLGHSIFNA